MMVENKLNRSLGYVTFNTNHVGCAVLFCKGAIVYAISAGHNIYGTEFKDEPDLTKLKVSDNIGIEHCIVKIFGDAQFAAKYDIVCLELDCQALDSFVTPKFSSIPRNPIHSLCFKARRSNNVDPTLYRKIVYHGNAKTEHQFLCSIEKPLLMNYEFKSGSAWLGGWSGCGLFYEHESELICAGIMIEIPNKGDDGQLMFTSISVLSEANFELEIYDSGELDFDLRFTGESLTRILNEVTNDSIKEWENQNPNSPQLTLVNRKVNEIYPIQNVEFQKKRILKSLLIGKSYLTNDLIKQEHLYDLYDKQFKTYGLSDMQFYVDSKPEALSRFQAITKEYDLFLKNALKDTFCESDIRTLVVYGISEWISICSIDFMKDER